MSDIGNTSIVQAHIAQAVSALGRANDACVQEVAEPQSQGLEKCLVALQQAIVAAAKAGEAAAGNVNK